MLEALAPCTMLFLEQETRSADGKPEVLFTQRSRVVLNHEYTDDLGRSWMILLGLNGLITLLNLLPRSGPSLMHINKIEGDDYPIEIPFLNPLDFVAMTLQETVEFSSNLSDPATEEQWATLLLQPVGMGRLHLGSKERVFTAIFWHQMHCIRELERGILDRSDKEATPHHIQHCLNYLRQHFLCEADYTLEEGDFMKRNFEYERSADTRVCRDWDRAYSIMGERIRQWAKNQKR